MNGTGAVMPTVNVSRLTEISNDGKGTKAYADVVIGEQYEVKGFRIVEDGKGELFVGLPQKLEKDGKYSPLLRPVTKEGGAVLKSMVLLAYKRLGKGGTRGVQG